MWKNFIKFFRKKFSFGIRQQMYNLNSEKSKDILFANNVLDQNSNEFLKPLFGTFAIFPYC